MADTRVFPEIDFIRENARDIYQRLVESWEQEMGRSLGKADPIRLHLAWEANIDAQIYAVINETAKMNVPRYAIGEKLDSISENYYYGLTRLEESAATVTMRFELTEPQAGATAIPAGTKVTKDGAVIFEVSKTTYIPAGTTYALCQAHCTQKGPIGNGYAEESINVCIDNDNVQNLLRCYNVTESDGGTARESDDDFYARMRESVAAYSTAGSTKAYEYHAKSASAEVGDAKAVRRSPGCVNIYIIREDGSVPEEDDEIIKTVSDHLNEENLRPMTDYVTVMGAEPVEFDVDLTWYREEKSAMNQSQMEAAVENAMTEYIEWQTTTLGRDINDSKLIQMLKEAGVKHVAVRSPEFKIVNDTEIASLRNMKVTFGGAEDA